MTLISDPVTNGLNYLLEETEYHNKPKSLSISLFPLLRQHCVKLAIVMHDVGITINTIEQWLDIVRSDPLPEVRHLVSEELVQKQ